MRKGGSISRDDTLSDSSAKDRKFPRYHAFPKRMRASKKKPTGFPVGFKRSSVDELQCNYRAQPQLETGAAPVPQPHPLAGAETVAPQPHPLDAVGALAPQPHPPAELPIVPPPVE